MSQQKKKLLRRKMAQVFQYQQKSIENLLEVAEIFGEWHPDYEEFYQLIAQNCSMTMDMVKRVCEHAWGYFPNDWHGWLK